jgi:hypothetical protein
VCAVCQWKLTNSNLIIYSQSELDVLVALWCDRNSMTVCIVIGSMCSINFKVSCMLHLPGGHGTVVSIVISFIYLIKEFIKANILIETEICEHMLNTANYTFPNPPWKVGDFEMNRDLTWLHLCDITNVRYSSYYFLFLISPSLTFIKEDSRVIFFSIFIFK